MDAANIWKQVMFRIRQRGDFSLGFWQALEAAAPIVVEADSLVVGFAGGTHHQKGHLIGSRLKQPTSLLNP